MQVILRLELGRRDEALAALAGRGLAVRPMHPGARDEESAAFQVLELDPGTGIDSARALAAELFDLPGIDGAYVKPPDEPA